MTATEPNAVLDHLVSRLDDAELIAEPWEHCYFTDALPKETIAEVLGGFAVAELAQVEETEREKTYRMRTRRLDLLEPAAAPSEGWQDLVAALTSARYRSAVSRLTGVPLTDTSVTVDLWQYGAGDWLAPHVDKPAKVVTQLFYFSEQWEPGMGGRLLVLDAADSVEPVRAYSPVTGASAMLVRSDRSWHAVERMRPEAAPRSSIAVTFWSADPATANAGS